MKSNTDRSMALAFGDLADQYDSGRPRLSVEFVTRVAHQRRIVLDRVLEVGAGTGQLTDGLLGSGCMVTALEPSAPMADRLRRRHQEQADTGQLSILTAPFEELTDSDGGYGSIWSADAWHWIDPQVAYESASRLLRPGGCLVALWTLSGVPENIAAADEVNRVYARLSPDLIRDPRQPIPEDQTAAGRDEIEHSGAMTVDSHWVERSKISLTPDQYADWQLSFAQIAAMTQPQRDELRKAILQTLHSFESDISFPVILDRYVVVARDGSPPNTVPACR